MPIPPGTRDAIERRHILIADDDPTFIEVASRILGLRFETSHVRQPEEICERLQQGEVDVVLLDLYFDEVETERTGFDVLEECREKYPAIPIIVVSRTIDPKDITRALDLGAFHFVTKHFESTELSNLVERAIHAAFLEQHFEAQRTTDALNLGGIVYSSPIMQQVIDRVRRFASSPLPVLITGESGTGKELVARLLHDLGRRGKSFNAVNITSLPGSLFESQVFGHERGAFTDARESRRGLLEQSHQGSLFLDEIGSLSLDKQAALLRVLEDGRVRRLGSETERSVDVRTILATHEDLADLRETGAFRNDLWYRISQLHIHIPPMRERGLDVLHIADSLIERMNGPVRAIGEDAREYLLTKSWPGNVRELLGLLHAACLYDSDGILGQRDLHRAEESAAVCEDEGIVHPVAGPGVSEGNLLPALPIASLLPHLQGENGVRREFRWQCLQYALALSPQNKQRAAEILGVQRQTLYAWLDEFGLRERKIRDEDADQAEASTGS
jgi:DNA-binding NtrC family response regulator